jgi:hypothetical protein
LALDEWNLNNSHTGRYDFFLNYPFESLKVGRWCPNLQACGLLAPLSSNRMDASFFGGVSSLNLGHPMLAWGGFLFGPQIARLRNIAIYQWRRIKMSDNIHT